MWKYLFCRSSTLNTLASLTFIKRSSRLLEMFWKWFSCLTNDNLQLFLFFPLREKCPNTEYFLVRILLYSVRIQENMNQKKLRIWTLFTQCPFLFKIGAMGDAYWEFDFSIKLFSNTVFISGLIGFSSE